MRWWLLVAVCLTGCLRESLSMCEGASPLFLQELQRLDRASPAMQAWIVERLPQRVGHDHDDDECREILGVWLRQELLAGRRVAYSRLQIARLRALRRLDDTRARQTLVDLAALEATDFAPYAPLPGERAAPADGLHWMAINSIGRSGRGRRNPLDWRTWPIPAGGLGKIDPEISRTSRAGSRSSPDFAAMTLRIQTLEEENAPKLVRELWQRTRALVYSRPAPSLRPAALCALSAGITLHRRAGLPPNESEPTLRAIVAARGRMPIADGDPAVAQALFGAAARELGESRWTPPWHACSSEGWTDAETVALMPDRERRARMAELSKYPRQCELFDELAALASDAEAPALRDRWIRPFLDGNRLILRSNVCLPAIAAVDARGQRPWMFARALAGALAFGRLRDFRRPAEVATFPTGHAAASWLTTLGRQNGGAMYRDAEVRFVLLNVVTRWLDGDRCESECDSLLEGLLETGGPGGAALLAGAIASLGRPSVTPSRVHIVGRMARRYEMERQARAALVALPQNPYARTALAMLDPLSQVSAH